MMKSRGIVPQSGDKLMRLVKCDCLACVGVALELMLFEQLSVSKTLLIKFSGSNLMSDLRLVDSDDKIA